MEKALISAELRHHHGNIKMVMEVLDLPRRTLNEKMQKYGLKRETFIADKEEKTTRISEGYPSNIPPMKPPWLEFGPSC